MTVRTLIEALSALPETMKDRPVMVVTSGHDVEDVTKVTVINNDPFHDGDNLPVIYLEGWP